MHVFRRNISLSLLFLVGFILSVVMAGAVQAQTKVLTPGTKSKLEQQLQKNKTEIDASREKANLTGTVDETVKKSGLTIHCLVKEMVVFDEDCNTTGDSGPSADAGQSTTLLSLISGMYAQPPATMTTYIADLGKSMNLGIVQPAYAQGLGFSALNPIIEVWKISRNLSYMLLIGALLVVGIMIMAGKRLGSKTEVTAQQAIPSLVVTLILITFSYAIAALLIEGMYLVMWLMAGLFQSFGGFEMIQGNAFELSSMLIASDIAGAGGAVFGRFIADTLTGGIGEMVGWGASLVASIVILLVIIFNSFKLFFALLKTYIEIILSIAFAPLILITGALPGQNPFPQWVKGLIGNLAVFPGILLLLLVYRVLRDTATAQGGGFMPPYLGGNSSAELLPFLAGLALILALPNAVDEIKGALGVKKGGLFQSLVEAGMKNAQKYQQTGTTIAAAGGLGLAGAGIGGALAARGAAPGQRGRAFVRGSATGLALGAGGGAALSSGLAWKLAKGTVGDAVTLGRQYLIANQISRRLSGDETVSNAQPIPVPGSPNGAPQQTVNPNPPNHDET